jgi:hypothetical protein
MWLGYNVTCCTERGGGFRDAKQTTEHLRLKHKFAEPFVLGQPTGVPRRPKPNLGPNTPFTNMALEVLALSSKAAGGGVTIHLYLAHRLLTL